MFNLPNRGELPESVEFAFEYLFSRLRGFLTVSFNEDGTLITPEHELNFVPVGAITPYAGATAPAGWLLCDGAQVSRVTYTALFNIVGTTYGVGDGSTTFNIPDVRQRFPLGKAASGTGATLGSTGGAIDHTHGNAHTHSFSATAATGGNHSHSGSTDSQGDHSHSISTDGSHSHSGTHAQSEDTGFVTVVPFSSPDGSHNHGGGTGSAGSHSHSLSINSTGDHSHSVSGTTGSAGGTTDAANPPYVVVNHIIFTGVELNA